MAVQDFKLHSGFFSWLSYYLFRDAIKVSVGDETKLVKISDILKLVLPDIDPKLVNSSKIKKRVYEYIDPVIGKNVTLKRLNKRIAPISEIQDTLKVCATAKKTEKVLLKHLEEIKFHKLLQMEFDPVQMQEILQPGDVIFCKIDEGVFNPAHIGQQLQFHKNGQFHDREGSRFVHAAIYVGNGMVVESVPSMDGDQVRKLHLSDPRFSMKGNSSYHYVISRCKGDESTGRYAAEIAEKLATPKKDEDINAKGVSKNGYAFIASSISVLKDSKFSEHAISKFIERHNDELENIFSADTQKFFCSQLVSTCYQLGEGKSLFPNRTLSMDNDGDLAEMAEKMKMTFDPDGFTPKDFRDFILNHKDVFKDVIYVKKPKDKTFEHQLPETAVHNLRVISSNTKQDNLVIKKEYVQGSIHPQYILKKKGFFERKTKKLEKIEKIISANRTQVQGSPGSVFNYLAQGR